MIKLLGIFLILMLISCSDAPIEPNDTYNDMNQVITVLDQHYNVIAFDTVSEFQINSLDTLSEGVYEVIVKSLSDSSYEFLKHYVGTNSWKMDGIGSINNTEIRDFFCVITSDEFPISGYCDQVTTVVSFNENIENENGALWTSCDFEVKLIGSVYQTVYEQECLESMQSVYGRGNNFENVFGNPITMRISLEADRITISNDSIIIKWERQ